ncbi:MAG: transporter substrate-binding domain-containing protein [Pseudomonadota bacterium]
MQRTFTNPTLLLALMVVLAVLGTLPTSGTAHAQTPVLTVVADEWPPFSGKDLPGQGMSPDIIAQVLQRAGYRAEVSILPWARIMHGVRSETAEFQIIGSLFYDDELAGLIDYSNAYVETEVKFVRRVGTDAEFKDLSSLKSYSIAVGDGFLYEDNFDRAQELNKVVVTTALQGVQLVAAGRADLTLDSSDVINYAVSVQDPTLEGKIEYLDKVLATRGIHMAVMSNVPNREQIINDFNAALRSMSDDGSLDRLLAKHRR